MRIAVDAMGGDFAPDRIVQGALQAARELPSLEKLYLVGKPEAVEALMPPRSEWPACIEIVPASEVVEMGEAPAVAVRRKRDSSIARSVELVKEGQADAVFSAGNTGAAVAASTLKMRLLEGVVRPAIATVMPTRKDPVVLVDAGANPECTAAMLAQFAVMGSVYAREILGVERPAVGLLSIGGEESKGNDITKETFQILKSSALHFVGNVEGHDLFEGKVHVVVCDGFVGNVVLKTTEAVAHFIGDMLKETCTQNPVRMMGALLLRGGFSALKRKADPARYGGAPLLGVNGVCIIGHGSSTAKAVFNGIRVACEAVNHRIGHHITSEIGALNRT